MKESSVRRIVKRDGKYQRFNDRKIRQAILMAFQDEQPNEIPNVQPLVDEVVIELPDGDVSVETIQDTVENVLMREHPDVAKSYIIYRQHRNEARQRREAPDPLWVADYIQASKYARHRDDLGRRELRDETVDRDRDMHKRRWPQFADEIDWAFDFVRKGKVLASMRSMQFGGAAIEKNNERMFNCLGVETQFITSEGVRSFSDFQNGDRITVMTHRGAWKRATVRSYGHQKLNRIRFARGRQSAEVRATSNHRWLTDRWVDDLQMKDRLAAAPEPAHEWLYEAATPEERYYWALGYVYGDGTRVKDSSGQYKYSMVRLCGDDGKYLSRFQELGFKTSSPPSCNGDAIAYTGHYLKEPPTHRDGVRNITAFVRGYLDADGGRSRSGAGGEFDSIQSSELDHIEFIRQYFPVAGVYILSEEDLTEQETNFGVRPQTVRFKLCMKFGQTGTGRYSVQEINEDQIEEVWCLEVEDDHSFVMPNGIVTGNCSFTLIDRIRAFQEIFYLLLCGCGVGYSVQWRHVEKLPKLGIVNESDVRHFVIPDTIEGWADALGYLFQSYLEGFYAEFSYHQIRPEGSPLKTSGGKAPGHLPLKRCIERVRRVLRNAQGRKLRPIECHDIICFIAEAVLAGGIRRSSLICLFSPEDTEMLYAKAKGQFDPVNGINPQRVMANNSAIFLRDKVNWSDFERVLRIAAEGWGEPGFFFTNNLDYGCNPCGEIGLNPVIQRLIEGAIKKLTGISFCNLSEVNIAACATVEEFLLACRAAALIGTLQAAYTDFPYLGEITEEIAKQEALIGVGLTGMVDNPDLSTNTRVLRDGAQMVVKTNQEWARKLGINVAARCTTVKPSGTSSLWLGCVGSGIHPHHARRYFRRITANPLEPPAQYFKKVNPHAVEVKPDGDWALVFPVEAPSNAITVKEERAVDFLNRVFLTFENWIVPGTARPDSSPGLTHNVSCTVTVREDELEEVQRTVWENRHRVAAMSFAPYSLDTIYPHAPREEVHDEGRWNELISLWKPVDWSSFKEESDETNLGAVVACEGAACEIGG